MSSQLIFKKADPVLYMIEYRVTSPTDRQWTDVHVCRTEKLFKSTLSNMKQGRANNGCEILATYEYRPKDTSRENGV